MVACAPSRPAGVDDEADIVVIDAAFSQDTGLIPLLVHNIRYWSVGEAQSLLAARNRVGDLGARDMLLFLALPCECGTAGLTP